MDVLSFNLVHNSASHKRYEEIRETNATVLACDELLRDYRAALTRRQTSSTTFWDVAEQAASASAPASPLTRRQTSSAAFWHAAERAASAPAPASPTAPTGFDLGAPFFWEFL
mmetsp:Transcript_23926/g.71777  ORF Transcript_23926/g.71777 Transcript_23926/m.71777 type:complete len:113 (-) Transcript_23926:50-388(-)